MKEENELLKKYGKKNPYRTPDGYFSSFAENLMEQLPEKEIPETPHISMWNRVKPWVYMAAMFVGLMFAVRVVTDRQPLTKDSTDIIQTDNIFELPDEYLDPIVNQTMMDDYELYEYLTDATPTIYK